MMLISQVVGYLAPPVPFVDLLTAKRRKHHKIGIPIVTLLILLGLQYFGGWKTLKNSMNKLTNHCRSQDTGGLLITTNYFVTELLVLQYQLFSINELCNKQTKSSYFNLHMSVQGDRAWIFHFGDIRTCYSHGGIFLLSFFNHFFIWFCAKSIFCFKIVAVTASLLYVCVYVAGCGSHAPRS